ncbi:MAG TPA: hypothetical protein VMB52_01640 [Verrucomicrobiae bacterium]|nr:hypothetical protein [Verrucomicrobiae bacterium]
MIGQAPSPTTYPGYGPESLASAEAIQALVPEAEVLNRLTTPEFRAMIASEEDLDTRLSMLSSIEGGRDALMARTARNGLRYPNREMMRDLWQGAAAFNESRGLRADDPSAVNLASYGTVQLPEDSQTVGSIQTGYYPSMYGADVQMDWGSTYPARGMRDRGMRGILHSFVSAPGNYVNANGEWRTRESLMTHGEKVMRALGRIADKIGDIDYAVGMWLGNLIENPGRLFSRKARAMGKVGINGIQKDNKVK